MLFPLLAIIFLSTVIETSTTRVWDPQNLISYDQGHGRIVISAPHGGSLRPSHLPDRVRYGCLKEDGSCDWTENCGQINNKKCKANKNRDANTQAIAQKVYDSLTKMGLSPHLVLSHVHRAKADFNRPIVEAAQGNKFAEAAYNSFHGYIQKARSSIKGPGLYVDIHSQGHREKYTEIGYRINTSQLISGDFSAVNSSMKSLAQRSNASNPQDLIIGPDSFGAILERRGYRVVPGVKIPKPNKGAYYRGGYNTLNYGSLDGGLIDGLQIEVTHDISKKSQDVYERYAEEVAAAIRDFMTKHGYFKG